MSDWEICWLSSIGNLTQDTGISENLAARIKKCFLDLSLLSEEADLLSLDSKTLPLVYFLLRATLGLDPLASLPAPPVSMTS